MSFYDLKNKTLHLADSIPDFENTPRKFAKTVPASEQLLTILRSIFQLHK